MIIESFIFLLAGMGLLFLSQARIQENLNELIFHRLRTGVARLLAHRSTFWLVGIYSSLLLQASRIPSQIATQLVGKHVLQLEQAFLLILGATLGSSLKSWFFAAQAHISMALVLLCSGGILYVLPKNRLSNLGAPLVAGAGFWASLEICWRGIEPLIPLAQTLFAGIDSSRLLHQFWLVLLAVGTVTLLRTGTLPVFVVIHLAWSGYLNLEAGVALMIGVNLGMSLFTLGGRERKPEMVQLAWCYGISRLLTTLILLFFFPYFVQVCALLVPGSATPTLTAYRLADCHVLINLLVAGLGYTTFGFLKRSALWITQVPEEAHALILSRQVRLMLQRSPAYARQEIEHQLQIALEHAKVLTDQNLKLLTDRRLAPDHFENQQHLFDAIQHSIYDLLLPLYLKGNQELRNQLHQSLLVLDHCGQVYFHAQQLYQELQQGLVHEFRSFPEALYEPLERYQTEFNEVWLAVLLRRKHFKNPESLVDMLDLLEESFLNAPEVQQLPTAQQIWTWRILSLLRQQCLMLYQVYTAQNPD